MKWNGMNYNLFVKNVYTWRLYIYIPSYMYVSHACVSIASSSSPKIQGDMKSILEWIRVKIL